MAKGIIGIGNPLIDYLLITEEAFLSSFGLTKGQFHAVKSEIVNKILASQQYEKQPGCSTANTFVAASLPQPHFPLTYIGKIGNDSDGNYFQKSLVQAKINPLLFLAPLPTGRAVTIITSDGERTFAVDLGASITLSVDDIKEKKIPQLLEEHAFFHFSLYQLDPPSMREAIAYLLQKTTTKISFDFADPFLVKKHQNLIKELLPKMHVIFANEAEARAFVDAPEEVSLAEIVKTFAKHVPYGIIKEGKKGSWLFTPEKIKPIASFPVEAIDTTGAGDMYAGTFLRSMLNQEPLEKAALRASFLAAKIVLQKGARLKHYPHEELKEKELA